MNGRQWEALCPGADICAGCPGCVPSMKGSATGAQRKQPLMGRRAQLDAARKQQQPAAAPEQLGLFGDRKVRP